MRIPITAHTQQPWRIHALTPDFDVQDVWAFRAPGAGPHDLSVMRAAIAAAGQRDRDPVVLRVLFEVRRRLGDLFGWDAPHQGAGQGAGRGGRVSSLGDRLPGDLRQTITGMPVPGMPFTHLYELDDEQAMEVANATVHAVAHFGWVQTGPEEYEMRMAVLVKANGLFGRAYMAAIAPFRHLIVYPTLTRQWERAWRDRVELLGAHLVRSEGEI